MADIKRPQITPDDRLGMTLCLAIITHGVVVLGVTFTEEDKVRQNYNTMEVVLVQQQSPNPDDAKLLAQAALEGGGNSVEQDIPATPTPPPFPDSQPDITLPPQSDSQPTMTEASKSTELLAAATEDQAVKKPKETNVKEKISEDSKTVEKPDVAMPSASTLLTNSFKIAALSAQIKRKLEAKAERTRRKLISASTREYRYAAYMEAWRAKVERVGNLNYPDEARRQNLSGNLILDVALNPDGSINEIIVRRSSGHKILDDAAIRIVNLAAPYSPFPKNISSEFDILHITRTWQFLNNKGFR